MSSTLLHLLAEFIFFSRLLVAPSSHSLLSRDFAFVFHRPFSSASSRDISSVLVVNPLVFAINLVAF